MSFYLQQEFDFIDRTKAIIKQYDSLEPDDKKFEVTLFINCLFGLLILPQQHWFNMLPEELLNTEKWGIDEGDIIFIKSGEEKNVKNIARHLRNSISHYRIKVFNNTSNEIKSMKFEDFDPKNIKTFEATFNILQMRKFVDSFTLCLVEQMKDN